MTPSLASCKPQGGMRETDTHTAAFSLHSCPPKCSQEPETQQRMGHAQEQLDALCVCVFRREFSMPPAKCALQGEEDWVMQSSGGKRTKEGKSRAAGGGADSRGAPAVKGVIQEAPAGPCGRWWNFPSHSWARGQAGPLLLPAVATTQARPGYWAGSKEREQAPEAILACVSGREVPASIQWAQHYCAVTTATPK